MSNTDARTWPEPPVAGSEVETLLGSLDRQRATFEWKTGGLDASALRRSVADSTMTLGGLLKHLALIEDHYCSVRLLGNEPDPTWRDVDWDAAPNWEWDSSKDDAPEYLYSLWRDSVERSRAGFARVLSTGGLDQLVAVRWPDGRAPSLRRTLVDLIEEYARHVGHADLIRESIDGVVGEDPEWAHPD